MDGATVATVSFGGEGPSLALVSTSDGSVQTFPLEGGELVEGGPIAFAPDGSQVVTLERDPETGVVSLVRRDPSDGALVRSDPLPMPNADAIAFFPSGDRLVVTGIEPSELWVLDAETLRSVRTVETQGHAFDISPDGRTLALGNDDGTVSLVDIASGARTQLEGRHAAQVSGVGFSPDGSTLVTTGDDRDVIVWISRPGPCARSCTGMPDARSGPPSMRAATRHSPSAWTSG